MVALKTRAAIVRTTSWVELKAMRKIEECNIQQLIVRVINFGNTAPLKYNEILFTFEYLYL